MLVFFHVNVALSSAQARHEVFPEIFIMIVMINQKKNAAILL